MRTAAVCMHWQTRSHARFATAAATATAATITAAATAAAQGFRMSEFSDMLASRPDEIMGDIFDTLMSLSDFNEFKELMLSHKRGPLLAVAGMPCPKEDAALDFGALSIAGESKAGD